MFGRRLREAEERELKQRRALTDRIMAVRDTEREQWRIAEGYLAAGDYSGAATACHRAHQAKLVAEKLLEVLHG